MIQTMSMDVDGRMGMVECILSENKEKWLESMIQVKNRVIGNNKQKDEIIHQGVIPRLLQWIIDEDIPVELRTESAIVLGSLAKGTPENISCLVDSGCVAVLLKGLSSNNIKFIEACLRCLRTIFLSENSPLDQIYQDPTVVPHLINILSKSLCTQECITTIFSNCCKTAEHQNALSRNGAIAALAPLLCSSSYKVQMPTLKCFAVLCYENEMVAKATATATYNGESIPNLLLRLLSRDKPSEMQMAAAKCMTYLCRGGAIPTHCPTIQNKTLSTLIRMCKKDRTLEENVEGAETLAYLIEEDAVLQYIASISDHIIKTLADYLRYTSVQQINTRSTNRKVINWSNELKQAAFRAFASLGANDEEIRKKIIETENLMEHIVNGMNCDDLKVQMGAVRCLHSLSRSVQQLRTTFQDHTVWKPLMSLMTSGPEVLLPVTSSTLCNLLLEFSPGKEACLEVGAINILAKLTSRSEGDLKLNGIWALMNMAFQADLLVKNQIVDTIGTEQLFRLLSDPDPAVLMKTLGLIRNLLAGRRDIDNLMKKYGNQIMQAVVFILEGDHVVEIKEQTLCILTNVADGDEAKEYIMGNEDVLKKLMTYMVHTNVKLQIAATSCISNLVWNEQEGAYSRQAKLRDLGIQKLLQQLLSANDSTLFDKVKSALQQFT
ncbi:armadillo repeat-containing protein 8-like isoform X2 [Saccostrea echinata]|uniref:armadillo repeat-containing protein 8-like isoform X2 n=1 Tax=Saccostrea echinata TaxID=191078 RepID=UPI002A82F5BA|nr:armadillo repeat-containing protein 8-like isoform X2 [Saccostrea echinata]